MHATQDTPFLFSTCSAADFFHPRYFEVAALLGIPPPLHRKDWEWVRILHTALERGRVGPGRRALGFGVGASEPLTAVFAKLGTSVTATDAPADVGESWGVGGQHAMSVESLPRAGLDRETFLERVRFEEADMRAIPAHLTGYDFAWSSCCLEHLGDLQTGLDFIVASVETCLAPGGVACHTTEFNLSSNEETLADGWTVLYRKRDLDDLCAGLRGRGHKVDELTIAPQEHPLDRHVDRPPYSHRPHLRFELEGYVSTSVAIVVERAP